MHITVFGANGKVGRGVVAEALRRGHNVTAFVHTHNSLGAHEHLQVVQGSIDDLAQVRESLANSTAVVSTLGSWHTKHKNVLSQAMTTIIPTMERLGIERLITLTGGSAFTATDQPSLIDRLAHGMAKLAARQVLKDSEDHLKLLKQSQLKWTCLRSPVMTTRQHNTYRLVPGLASPFNLIPRAAVVHALLDQLESTEYVGRAPSIVAT